MSHLPPLPPTEVERLVTLGLSEDLRSGDATSAACIAIDAGGQGELVARVSAILRRAAGGKSGEDSIDATPYAFDSSTSSVELDGEAVSLTNREFALASFLFRNPGKMLSRSHILEAIWGIENAAVSTRTVDTHISRLRRKLKLGPDNGWKLSAIYQHGYRMERVDR